MYLHLGEKKKLLFFKTADFGLKYYLGNFLVPPMRRYASTNSLQANIMDFPVLSTPVCIHCKHNIICVPTYLYTILLYGTELE